MNYRMWILIHALTPTVIICHRKQYMWLTIGAISSLKPRLHTPQKSLATLDGQILGSEIAIESKMRDAPHICNIWNIKCELIERVKSQNRSNHIFVFDIGFHSLIQPLKSLTIYLRLEQNTANNIVDVSSIWLTIIIGVKCRFLAIFHVL